MTALFTNMFSLIRDYYGYNAATHVLVILELGAYVVALRALISLSMDITSIVLRRKP